MTRIQNYQGKERKDCSDSIKCDLGSLYQEKHQVREGRILFSLMTFMDNALSNLRTVIKRGNSTWARLVSDTGHVNIAHALTTIWPLHTIISHSTRNTIRHSILSTLSRTIRDTHNIFLLNSHVVLIVPQSQTCTTGKIPGHIWCARRIILTWNFRLAQGNSGVWWHSTRQINQITTGGKKWKTGSDETSISSGSISEKHRASQIRQTAVSLLPSNFLRQVLNFPGFFFCFCFVCFSFCFVVVE